MAKLWRFLSVPIVLAVCLGLLLVPVAVPGQGQVALASGNVTVAIEPATTHVSTNASFTIDAVINNPDGMEVAIAMIELDFDPSYFAVDSVTKIDFPEDMGAAAIDNVNGTISYQPKTTLGTSINLTTIISARINCTAKSLEGISTVNWVYEMGPPPRWSTVEYGATDYLEGGNMSLMHNGTVIVGTPAVTYNLTTSSSAGGNVTTPGEGTYSYNASEVVDLVATADTNYSFVNWTGDVSTIGDVDLANTNITMDGNYSIVANFAEVVVVTYNLTTSSTAGGSVTTPGEGTFGPYNASEVVDLVATPDTDYSFVNWTGDTGKIGNVNSATTNITMDGNYSIVANFAESQYDVTVAIENATTYVLPNGSFTIDAVINNPNGMEVAIAMIELDFDPSYFTVDSVTKIDFPEDMGAAAIDNVNGMISYQPKTTLGTSINLTTIISARINCTAKSLEGISTVNWVYEMGPPPRWSTVEYGATDYLEGGNMSLMHNGTVIVGDVFNLTVTSTGCCPINVSGGRGTVAAGSSQLFIVPCSENVTLTADESDTCCVFDNWTVDGNTTGSNPVVVNGTADSSHTAVANCSVPRYNLTMNVTGNGTTSPSGTSSHSCGEEVNISATADPGWQFVNWTTTNLSEIATPTAASTTVTVDENKTVTATFAEITAATLEGHVAFAGRGSNNTKWAEQFNVTLCEAGNLTHVLWAGNATTNNTGVFNISGLAPGTYDIGIKNWTCLSEVNTSVMLSAGNTTVVDFGTTREGDADNNDHINILDASSLVGAFGSSQGGPGWNAHCDFNRDTNVNILDASALASNFGEDGDLT